MSALLPIRIDGLAFWPNGRPVLQGLTAAIAAPGITAVIGPNGAGKSVLLRLIDGLLAPDAGSIRFGSVGAARGAPRLRVPEARPSAGERGPERRAGPLAPKACRARSRTGGSRRPCTGSGSASGPTIRRAGCRGASSSVWRSHAPGRPAPDLLLLDEPTANLDPGATDAIERLVADMAQAGTKVILVSHNLGQVGRLAEDVVVLSGGRVVEHGATHAVLKAPRSPEARAYLTGELPWTAFAAA